MYKLKILIFTILFIVSCGSDDPVSLPIEENDEPIKNEFLKISFPNNYINHNNASIMVILSDENGKYIDSKSHLLHNPDVIFTESSEFNSSSNFMLTFVSTSTLGGGTSATSMKIYTNLNKSSTGNEIVFQPRGNFLKSRSKSIDAPFFQNGYILNSNGYGYNLIRTPENKLTGNITFEYTDDLGLESFFIKYYNPFDPYEYHWGIFPNDSDITVLNKNDLKNENIIVKQLSTNITDELPLLDMYGFENEKSFNILSGHRIYFDYLQAYGFASNHYYSYPDIFYKTFYSLSFSNYSLTGLGELPQEVIVPDYEVSANVSNKEIFYEGVNEYEVGRIQLGGPSVAIDLTFDATLNKITLPKIPDDILPKIVTETLNSVNFNVINVFAENYESFDNYGDYISGVLKTTTPFYINSPKRERVYKTYVSPHVYAIREFPYLFSIR